MVSYPYRIPYFLPVVNIAAAEKMGYNHSERHEVRPLAAKILLSCGPNGAPYYEAAVRAAGGLPTSIHCPSSAEGFDALLLCGGEDLAPDRYGQEDCGSQTPDLPRDAAELAMAEAFLSSGKPILGICRGIQLLNVALGGTLIQDLGPLVPFHAPDGAGTYDKVHPIQTQSGSLLHRWYGPICSVNSSHHQALDRLGEGLVVTARSESGVVEAVELPGRAVFGVQFHPERMTGDCLRPDAVDGAALFRWLLEQC